MSRRQRNALIVAGLLRKISLIAGRQRLSALPLLSSVPERRSQRRMSAAMVALFPKWMDSARVLQSPYDQGWRLTRRVAGWSDLGAWSDWFEDIVHHIETVSLANLRSSMCLKTPQLSDCGRQLLEWLIQYPHVQRGCGDAPFCHRYLVQIHGESWQPDDLAAVTDLWLRVVSDYSPITAYHSIGVAHVLEEMRPWNSELQAMNRLQLIWLGVAHDVGKLAMPRWLLQKKGLLSDEEFHILREHAIESRNILSHWPGWDYVGQAIQDHHENLDGTGYPEGKIGVEIEPLARVLSIADRWRAMLEVRPYREALDPKSCCRIMDHLAAGDKIDGALWSRVRSALYDQALKRQRGEVSVMDPISSFDSTGEMGHNRVNE